MENQPKRPSNYLALAIISTVLCCIPTGIVSIIYASKVNTAYAEGKYEDAESASKNARLWALIGIGLALVGWLIYVAFFGFAIFTGVMNG